MDKLGVINLALMKTGLPLASSLDACDWNAALVFDNVAEQDLRCYAWGFAQRFAVIARKPTEPAFGYKYAYAVPADCLRLIDIHCQTDLRSPKAPFRQVGNDIYTSAPTCFLRYTARILEPEKWPPDFTNAVASHIAVEIAALSAEKISLVPQLIQLYNLNLATAQQNDARENTERVPLDDSLFAAREGQQG